MPASYEVNVIGAISTPAERAEHRRQAEADEQHDRRVLMPTSCAASRLCEVASIALPSSVRPKNQRSKATTSQRRAEHPQALRQQRRAEELDRRVAGKRRQRVDALAPDELRPGRAGTDDAPMVMMISVTTSALLGRLDREILHQQADQPGDADGERRSPTAAACRGRHQECRRSCRRA